MKNITIYQTTVFSLRDEKLFTLHGIRKYTDHENYRYQQWRNNRELNKRQLISRVIPANINTTGKFGNSQFDGYDSFELDLIYRDENGGYLEVGIDKNSGTGVTLKDFLKLTHKSDGQKIWLNIKNLTPDNINGLTHCLLTLNKIYDLKNRVLIESVTTDESFSKLSDAGFNTSYKLPGAVLKKLVDDGSEKKLEEMAVEMSRQVKNQKVKSISFDHELFPFVENYLKKHIDGHVDFHTRDLSLSLKDENFMSSLLNKPYFKEPRVKTILVYYHSNFSL